MAQRVFLHVGLPKSGTTYVQAVLGKNRKRLRTQARLLYPGAGWKEQVDAVRDVREMRVPGSQRAQVSGAWPRLVEEIAAWDGDAVVSMEWLCAARPEHIRRVAEDLRPAEVHVVFTVRDLGRTIPAAWQEFMQNRQSWAWPEFLEAVASPSAWQTEAGEAFWSQQDMHQLLVNWLAEVPREQTHVITLPQSGADPTELWRRMARTLDIDADGYVLDDLGANQSLGFESAELMRRVNERVRGTGLSLPRYRRAFKRDLAKTDLAARKGQESTLVVPESYHAWVRGAAEGQIRAIEESGVRVVGDLDELRPLLGQTRRGATATVPSAEALLEAAVDVLVTVALDRSERLPRAKAGKAGARPVPVEPVPFIAVKGMSVPDVLVELRVRARRRFASGSPGPGRAPR